LKLRQPVTFWPSKSSFQPLAFSEAVKVFGFETVEASPAQANGTMMGAKHSMAGSRNRMFMIKRLKPGAAE
jgi:hypothetical protein